MVVRLYSVTLWGWLWPPLELHLGKCPFPQRMSVIVMEIRIDTGAIAMWRVDGTRKLVAMYMYMSVIMVM
jgi:hypothetical protein